MTTSCWRKVELRRQNHSMALAGMMEDMNAEADGASEVRISFVVLHRALKYSEWRFLA